MKVIMRNYVQDIREYFIDQLAQEKYVTDKTGCKMIELVGASFIANEAAIFGEPNQDYIRREIDWYESRSLNVNDIPPPVPQIWKQVATPDGFINSNYGYLIWSHENHDQFNSCRKVLEKDPYSRRAIMIYTRPSIQTEYNRDGMSDFICTNTVQYMIRDDKLHAFVDMRSNDVVFGYRNDYAWQRHVLFLLSDALKTTMGDIHWHANSLHVYERHFSLVK
jgi:thymidylate synthase